jgi:hypothetical protein
MRRKIRRVHGMYHFQTNLKDARAETRTLVVRRVAMARTLILVVPRTQSERFSS